MMSKNKKNQRENYLHPSVDLAPIPQLAPQDKKSPIHSDSHDINENAPLVVVQSEQKLVVRAHYSMLGISGARKQTVLREPVARRLRTAASSLPEGFMLVLLDGWRSGATQKAIYDYFTTVAKNLGQDPGRYAFDLDSSVDRGFPTEDAPHRTGAAVDVTLIGADGNDWPMGTEFDEISPRSATRALEIELSNNKLVEREALLGRRLLYHVMTKAGFTNYPDEWWHYDYGNGFWKFYGNFHNGDIFRTLTEF